MFWSQTREVLGNRNAGDEGCLRGADADALRVGMSLGSRAERFFPSAAGGDAGIVCLVRAGRRERLPERS